MKRAPVYASVLCAALATSGCGQMPPRNQQDDLSLPPDLKASHGLVPERVQPAAANANFPPFVKLETATKTNPPPQIRLEDIELPECLAKEAMLSQTDNRWFRGPGDTNPVRVKMERELENGQVVDDRSLIIGFTFPLGNEPGNPADKPRLFFRLEPGLGHPVTDAVIPAAVEILVNFISRKFDGGTLIEELSPVGCGITEGVAIVEDHLSDEPKRGKRRPRSNELNY